MKQINKYFKDHAFYSACIYLLTGLGLGILITYPFIGSHPLRWGIGLLGIALAGHLYPLMIKYKK